jgi:phosphatidylserine decarboxylase
MGQKIKKLKKIRLHREGTDQLVTGAIALVAIAAILWTTLDNKIPFWAFVVVFGTVYGIVLNFYRCPIRYLNVEDTSKLVVAPADGKIVVIEEVENAPYFGDRRLMISIFMSLWIQETLKQKVVLQWVNLGNAQAVSHHRTCRRSTSLAILISSLLARCCNS